LLTECVEKYLELNEEQQREFERLLATDPYREARTVATTSFEKGEVQGQRRVLQRQLAKRFGPLSEQVRARLDALSAERLEELALAVLDAKSLKELGLED
jgi:hypothetical protein